MHLEKIGERAGSLNLTIDQFEKVRGYIYGRTGIFFQERKKYLLESRLGQRMRSVGVADFDQYYDSLDNDRLPSEVSRLLNAVTINETYFFRNPSQFEVLVHEIIPNIVERKRAGGDRTITMWSAGCSTGDEPYTLAILIAEHLKHRYPEFQFSLLGTDINTEVLEYAARAVYGSYAVRNVPRHLLTKYFTQEGAVHALRPEIRNSVRLRRHNLIDTTGPTTPESVDVVLCANVLIYFDIAARRQAVQILHGSLRNGGVLLLGFSESLNGVTDDFRPLRYSRMVAYRKD